MSGPAARVLMVRPAHFGYNEETASTNAYQGRDTGRDVAARATAEHDALVASLRAVGVEVRVLEDRADVICPDAVFPNNWISFHPDGTVVLYPMATPSRGRERRLEEALASAGVSPKRVVDLTGEERRGRALEGTGSLVLDHQRRLAFASRSPRTDPGLATEWAGELGYDLHLFDAVDREGRPVYHTNVVLALGSEFAVVGAEHVVPADRERLLAALAETGRAVIRVSHGAVGRFAANVLELQGAAGRVLACSAAARGALEPHWETISARVDAAVVAPIPTIEAVGGGSVRCTLAEVFDLSRTGTGR